MSWLFGFIGTHLSPESAGRFQAVHPPPRVAFHSPTTYFAAGGLPETFLHGAFANQQRDEGWAVTGVGLERSGENCRFLTGADWQQTLSAASPPLKKLDGHFVAVKWQAENIECFTDQLGLRTLFLTSLDGGTVFSTRLDWLAKLRRQNEVDFAACGSSWLTFNQIGYEAFLKNIRRLGPNGSATLSPASAQFHHAPWTPDSNHNGHDVVEVLEAFLHPAASERMVSLGLSGGLDSRTLLALLASQKRAEFSLHVFGLAAQSALWRRALQTGKNHSRRRFW